MKNFDIIARALSTNNELISQCQTDINAIKGKGPSKPFYEIDLTVLLNNLTLNGNKNDIPTENILNVFDKISLAYSGLETRLSAYQFTLKPNLAPYNLPAGAPTFISSIPCDINVIDYSGDKVVNIIFIYKNINNTLSEMQFGFIVKADNSIVNGFILLNAFVSSDDLTRIDATIEENELVISNALNDLNERVVSLENVNASIVIANLSNQITTMQQTITELQAEIETMKTELNKTLTVE